MLAAAKVLASLKNLGSLPSIYGIAEGSIFFFQRSLATPPRFYKNVRVKEAPEQGVYQVWLDTSVVKTPAKKPLLLPTHALALATAAEWDWQTSNKPNLKTMPLTSLAYTAIDQPQARSVVINELLKYVHTDAACCRYDLGPLAERQAVTFNPLLAWADEHLGLRLVTTNSIFGTSQSQETEQVAQQILEMQDSWHLVALQELTAACKSFVLALSLVKGRMSPFDAIRAARLEEDYQIEDWGMVEAGHDLDIVDITSRVYGPVVFLDLLKQM